MIFALMLSGTPELNISYFRGIKWPQIQPVSSLVFIFRFQTEGRDTHGGKIYVTESLRK